MKSPKAKAKSCETCVYCFPAFFEENGKQSEDKNTGFCRRYPPSVTGPAQSSYPPVKKVDWNCGEYRKAMA